jgi:phosphoglycolate phosphatase-like HAD superfamily hydrolase
MRRLLLFDIDGTLVRGGPAKVAFENALHAVFGTAGPIDGHDFSGKTDPQIARELLTRAGLQRDAIDAGFAGLWCKYLDELTALLPSKPMTVLPGVRALLRELNGMDDVGLGLLTGNIVDGARLKLSSVGLMDYFSVGSYGSDSEVREDLTAVAMVRASERWGVDFPPGSVVVVGDTPRDVACGKHGGTRTVAVATGRYSMEDLAAAGPDAVIPDLSDLASSIASLV